MKNTILLLSLLFAITLNSQCVSTLAGSTQGYANDIGTSAMFNNPYDVVVDAAGNIFVVDYGNFRIRKINPSGSVTTFAGSTQGYADGVGTAAKFNYIYGIAIDISGNLYVTDAGKIRKITSSGVVTTMTLTLPTGFSSGFFTKIALDASNNIFTTMPLNNMIVKITPSGVLTVYAGTTQGFVNGDISVAKFDLPSGLAIDASGNVYVADKNNTSIRKITPSGLVSTVAGSTTAGSADGIGTAAQFLSPLDVEVDAAGNLYVADAFKIRKITSTNTVSTLAGPTTGNASGYVDGNANVARFNVVYGLSFDMSGNLHVADQGNHKIRKVTIDLSANINYTGSPFCKSLSTPQSVSLTGTGTYSGGTYSSTTGLSLNSSTGAITPSTSTAGTYTITYTTSTSSGCAYTTTTQVSITTLPTVTINYSGSPFCKSLVSAQTVTINGTGIYSGGTFSSSTGLSINATTGAITPSTSTSGTYTVSYSTPASGGCSAVIVSTQIIITALSTATINYIGSPFCKSISTPQSVTLTGTGSYTNGTFSSSAGLIINTTTGAITPSTSTAGNYTITYTIPANGGCSAVLATSQIVILSVPTVSISADGTIATSISINNGNAVQLQLNGSLAATPNIQWTPSTSISSSSIANPIVYPNATTTYTASFTNSNGCQQSTSIIVNINPIPTIGNISLTSTNTTVGLFNGNIAVDVQLSNVTNLYSLYMKLKSNAAVNQYLDYDGYTAGTLLGSGGSVISTQPTVTSGVPDFGISKVGPVSGYNGSGLFYTLRFKPKNITIPNGTVFCFYLDDINAYNASGVTSGLNNQGQICYTYTYQVDVWPGDLNKSNNVSTADLLPIGYFYNSTGPARPNATIQWYAQPATLWGTNHSSQNGNAYKVFADSNGDGIINNADQAAIGFNMGLVHNRQSNNKPFVIAPNLPDSQQTSGTLIVTPNISIINGATLPQTVTFNVNLNNTGGLTSLYGISVNLIFDNTIFDLSTATINYSGSIFGNAGTDCLVMNYNSSTGVSVGLTRFANAAINGNGLLFKVTLQTKTTLPNLSTTQVTAYVDSANNQIGEVLEISDSMPIDFSVINNNLSIKDNTFNNFKFYPNPAREQIIIDLGNNSNIVGWNYKIVNTLGQQVQIGVLNSQQNIIQLNNIKGQGVYFINIYDSLNFLLGIKKIIIQQ